MSTVRNIQYVNGQLSYRGYSITQVMGIGEECYGQYVWSEYEASSTFDFALVEETLESLLNIIDYRLDNSLTSKQNELGEAVWVIYILMVN